MSLLKKGYFMKHDKTTVSKTVYLSLIVQFVTTAISLDGLNYNLQDKDKILRTILILEAIVQGVEAFFYIWVIKALKKINIMSSRRYVDWFITTPLMLFTTTIFMQYQKNKEEGKEEIITIPQFIEDNKEILVLIFLFNYAMLFFGLMHELKTINPKQGISKNTALPIGFVCFFVSFFLIYDNFAKYTEYGRNLFYFLIIVWGLYGYSAYKPPIKKNTYYNCLDIVSKNFYGLFLYYYITQISERK